MPTVGGSAVSVAANSKSAEQLGAGSILQFAPFDGRLSLYSKASATGLNITLFVGSDLVVNDTPIAYTGTAGTLAVPDNLIDEINVAAGSQLSLTFRNTTGGALTADYIVRFVPI